MGFHGEYSRNDGKPLMTVGMRWFVLLFVAFLNIDEEVAEAVRSATGHVNRVNQSLRELVEGSAIELNP